VLLLSKRVAGDFVSISASAERHCHIIGSHFEAAQRFEVLMVVVMKT
jgi:hypothetical protein